MKTNTKLYTEKEVRRLFDSFAVLLGEEEAVPKHIAADIFGEDALDFTARLNPVRGYGDLAAGFGIGNYTAYGLTLRGMKIAATYCNVLALKEYDIVKAAYDEE